MKETRLAMRFRAAVTGNAHMRVPELTMPERRTSPPSVRVMSCIP